MDKDEDWNKTNFAIDRIENSEEQRDERTDERANEERDERLDERTDEGAAERTERSEAKSSNQSELFESKLRSILFPEPIFSQYIGELSAKPSKPVKFPSVEAVLASDEASKQKNRRKHDTAGHHSTLPSRPQYTRYLRTWKKSVSQSDRLTAYLSSLRELHLAKLIATIEQLHKSSLYTDLDLYVDDLCFPVHKLILACYAPFIFQKLERNRVASAGGEVTGVEGTKGVRTGSGKKISHPIEKLKLVNIDAQSLAILIGFMYTGLAQPTETNFLPVLNAAIHLFMFDFANAWVELYEHRFTSRTAQLLFRSNIARQYGWTDYTQMLNVALALDFEHLLISDQFEALPFEQLRDILRLNNIGVAR